VSDGLLQYTAGTDHPSMLKMSVPWVLIAKILVKSRMKSAPETRY